MTDRQAQLRRGISDIIRLDDDDDDYNDHCFDYYDYSDHRFDDYDDHTKSWQPNLRGLKNSLQ